MNTRTRQKIKAELRRENPDVMATIRDEGPWRQIIFVPRSEVQAYKARYGDRIKFWEVEEDAVNDWNKMISRMLVIWNARP